MLLRDLVVILASAMAVVLVFRRIQLPAIAAAWGAGTSKALFLGFLVALSSTAIALKGLTERGEVDAPHGKLIVGMLLFQDLCVVRKH